MGPLLLPTGEPVYVDANAIICSVERVEPYSSLLAPMWEEAKAGRFTLASSEEGMTLISFSTSPLKLYLTLKMIVQSR